MMTDSVAKVVAETITEAEAVGAEHKHSIETWWNVSGVTNLDTSNTSVQP
jgi:hypothetical protein